MAESTWPDPAIGRTVTDIQYEQLVAGYAGDGIAGAPNQTAVVYGDTSGRQVKIRANKIGAVRGRGWNSGPTDVALAITANGGSAVRYDLVVLRLTRSTWKVAVAVKTGTAGSGSPPALQQDLDPLGAGSGVFEIPLAVVSVGAGVTTINAGDVAARTQFFGYPQELWFPDLTTLNLLPAPVPGQVAIVVDQRYLYTVGVGWRRADWYVPWGVIGGQEYTGNGGATAVGVASTELALNISSGTVALTAGRRYRVRCRYRSASSASGGIQVLFVKESSTTGAARAGHVLGSVNNIVVYEEHFDGEWNEAAGGTRTFVMTGYSVAATMNIYRTSTDNERAGIVVEDLGPYAALPSPI